MAQEYLPAPSNVRLADLMKEHNISQPELAKEIGCSKSTISRFISGAKGTLTHEQVLKSARLFNVSTDFLLGETNIPDRKNYDIAELGLSVEAAKNLYTGRVNTEVVNLLLENARFAELTYRITVKLWAGEYKAFVEILDQGRGIPPEDLENVKTKFYKGSNAVRGSGIGLALVDSIMTALDGTMDIQSTLGRGTVVTLGLPLYHKA